MYSALRNKGKKAVQISNRFFGCFLVLTFMCLPTVVIRCLSAFECNEIEGPGGELENVLVADSSIDCDSDRHKAFQLYSLVMLGLWAFGIPVMYAWLLMHESKSLDPGQKVR